MSARQRPWHDPKSFAVSIAGAVLILLGLTVADSMPLVVVGAVLTVIGFVLSRRND